MPRTYKKVSNRVSYTNEQFEAAKEVLKNTNIRKVSKDFNIPYTTLQNWRTMPNRTIGSGKKIILNGIEEGLIVSALDFTAKCGFPKDVRILRIWSSHMSNTLANIHHLKMVGQARIG